MKKFFEEFRKFIMRGNIVDMSVGVIVGGAFTSIVNGLTNNILKPVINWFLALLLGTDSLSEVYTYLKRVEVAELDANGVATGNMVVDLSQSIYIDWGAFINAIINFLIIAFVLFIILKAINAINESHQKMQDIQTRIDWKKENNIKLSKKEKAFLVKAEKKAKEDEAKRLAEEEALKNQPKPVTTEDLLVEIRDLLKNK
jgi:large conductance mechanosensitive channel